MNGGGGQEFGSSNCISFDSSQSVQNRMQRLSTYPDKICAFKDIDIN